MYAILNLSHPYIGGATVLPTYAICWVVYLFVRYGLGFKVFSHTPCTVLSLLHIPFVYLHNYGTLCTSGIHNHNHTH